MEKTLKKKRKKPSATYWLVGVGLIACLVRWIAALGRTLPVFEKRRWLELTTPEGGAYSPWFKPLLIGELIAEVALTSCLLAVLVLFFQRRRRARNGISIFLSFTLAFVALDNIVVNRMPGKLVSVTEFLFWVVVVLLWAGLFASAPALKKDLTQ